MISRRARIKSALMAGCLAVFSSPCPVSAAERPDVDRFLTEGRLQDGVSELETWLKSNEGDDQAILSLGVLQFVQGVERLSQDLYRYGLRDLGQRIGFVPFLRLPVPENPQPQALSYAAAREIVTEFIRRFEQAERTLAAVDGPVNVPIHLARIRIDMNGDGNAAEAETLWTFYQRLNRAGVDRVGDADSLVVAFDRADAHWLRGYCHLLMALGEFALAHDAQDLFDRTAHIFFADVETPYEFLAEGRGVFRVGDGVDIADFVAVIHLFNFRVAEPERMTAVHGHLKSMIGQSRAMWEHAIAEEDDENEWIPNAKQTSSIANLRVSAQMIDDWQVFLAEADALLDGKKLIPFWRGTEPRGVNLKRVLLEPRAFDLVMWVQGTAAVPYLERGELTQAETWARLQRTFQGNFVGFAIWFN